MKGVRGAGGEETSAAGAGQWPGEKELKPACEGSYKPRGFSLGSWKKVLNC